MPDEKDRKKASWKEFTETWQAGGGGGERGMGAQSPPNMVPCSLSFLIFQVSACWRGAPAMRRNIKYHKPAGSLSLKNCQFHSVKQGNNEYFVSFCNRVKKVAKLCNTTISVRVKTNYFPQLYQWCIFLVPISFFLEY